MAWHKKFLKKTTMCNYRILLFVIIGGHFLLIFLTGLFRHWGYITSINDLGVFDQAVWGLLNGEPFLNTILFQEKINWIAVHFHPILLIFTPFYLIYSSPFWLILSQALALSLAAWPIFLLGRLIFNSDKTASLWATVYLVNPFVLNAAAWDFHPISLAVPFVALGMLALESKNLKLMGLSVLVILFCKEHLGIMVIGFGLLWWIKNGQWKPGLLLMVIGFIHFYTVLKIIMPALSPTGQHVMVSNGLGHLSRYAWLGQSVGDIISYAALNPYLVLKTVLFQMNGAFYLFLLLLPFLGFSLAGLPFLLPGIADLAANMLSNISMPRSPMAYHSVTLVPIFTIAAIYGVKKIGKWFKKFSATELSGLILIFSLFTGYLLAPFPLPGSLNYWASVSFVNLPNKQTQELRALAGNDTSISVQANIGAHFSQRKEIYRFPDKIEKVNLIILRLDSPTTRLTPHQPGPLGALADHLQIGLLDYLQIVEGLVRDDDFHISYWNDPWLVFSRESKDTKLQKEVGDKLNKLRKEWLGIKSFEKDNQG